MTLKIEHGIYLIIFSAIYFILHINISAYYYDLPFRENTLFLFVHLGAWANPIEPALITLFSSFIFAILVHVFFKSLSTLKTTLIILPNAIYYLSLIDSSRVLLPYVFTCIVNTIIFVFTINETKRFINSPLKNTFDFDSNNKSDSYIGLLITLISLIVISLFLIMLVGDYKTVASRESFPYLNIILACEIVILHNLRFNPSIFKFIISMPIAVYSFELLYRMCGRFDSIF